MHFALDLPLTQVKDFAFNISLGANSIVQHRENPRLLMSSTPYDISALVDKINATSKDLGKDTGEARRQCLDSARLLSFALETPVESILRNVWAEV